MFTMRKILKNIILSSVLLFSVLPIFNYWDWWNVKLFLPDAAWSDDVNIDSTQVESDEKTIFDYIRQINWYLWFAIAWVAMAVLVYAWIMMITASWDKAKFSKAWKLALSCVIAITIAMLSYTVVNLIVKLF